MTKYFLFEMTRPEIEEALANGMKTAVCTFGSTEQHGLHLPMGTDSIWGEDLGHRIARGLGDALLLPGVRVGCSEHHMAFAGSLTLRKEIFIEVVRDICHSVARHGFEHLALIPTHGGNFAPLAEAVAQIQPELPALNLITFSDLRVFMDALVSVGAVHDLSPEVVGGHAGEHETSVILALRPDLVQMEQAEEGFVGDFRSIAADIIAGGFEKVTPNGILGDPRPGTAVVGEEYMQAKTDLLVAYIRAQRKSNDDQ
ncbi:MAG: creatininase family protein [Chloroflexota bacterium]